MIIIKISDIYEVRVDPYNYSLYKKHKSGKRWICLGHYQDMKRVLLALSREEMKPTEEETIKEYIVGMRKRSRRNELERMFQACHGGVEKQLSEELNGKEKF